MHSHKITILIPTKDRKLFLYQTLKTCLNQAYENYMVVVLDDGSSDGSVEMIEELMKKQNKLKLVKNVKNVGMMDNFENALDEVDSGYVIFLGGDDALMPNALIDLNNLINQTNAELITWPHHTFFYPGTKMKSGQIIINRKSLIHKNEYEWIKGEDYLYSQANKLFYVSDEKSPMIYVKGIASVKVINEIKSKSPNNRFYQCSTPDGYSGFVLAGHLKKYLFCKQPYTIHGVCNNSQGLNYVKKGRKALKTSQTFFKKMKDVKMNEELGSVPYSPLITLMTADFIYTTNKINSKKITINPKSIIEKSLSELQDGLYGDEKIKRELKIISDFSKYVSLHDYFIKQLQIKKRNKRYNFEGNGFSPRLIYINASNIDIDNVYEASYFIKHYLKFNNSFNLTIFLKAFINSLKYKLSSFRKGERLMNYYVDSN